jgi:DNA-binding IclR family transcriptional regulator
MPAVLESNKTKIAKRVIEVFEFFDAENRYATVMDIVRRYGRPQSSTSELLASLVELGLLYKEPMSRSYTPTPRLATLGSAAQPEYIRDGRLYAYMDRLAQSTRHTVALFGIVDTYVQIFRLSAGAGAPTSELCCGSSDLLSASAAGLLLLSTLGKQQTSKVLWRLNALAPPEEKFSHVGLTDQALGFSRQGYALGDAGFVSGAQACSVLMPCRVGERPLALSVIYPNNAPIDSEALVATLRHGVGQMSKVNVADYSIEAAPFVRAV